MNTMTKSPVDPEAAHTEAVADAKRLMRTVRTAAHATLDPASGAPIKTVVTSTQQRPSRNKPPSEWLAIPATLW